MTDKICLIKQPAGLGDIFFLQKAATQLIENGYHIVWPIADQYEWIIDYIGREGISYGKVSEDFPHKKYYEHTAPIISENFIFLPFQNSDMLLQISPMKAKYPMVYMTSENWQDHFNFTRKEWREQMLKERLGLSDEDEFIFVNDMLGSPPDIYHREMDIQTDLKVIRNDMELFDEFNPMDYCWILENAKEIHTVETSFSYLVEKLNTTDKLFLYTRMIGNKNQLSENSYIDLVYSKEWDIIKV